MTLGGQVIVGLGTGSLRGGMVAHGGTARFLLLVRAFF